MIDGYYDRNKQILYSSRLVWPCYLSSSTLARLVVFALRPTGDDGHTWKILPDSRIHIPIIVWIIFFLSHSLALVLGYFYCRTSAADGRRYPAVGPAVLPYCCCRPHPPPAKPATGLRARGISQLSKRRRVFLPSSCICVKKKKICPLFFFCLLFSPFRSVFQFKNVCGGGGGYGCRMYASRPRYGFSEALVEGHVRRPAVCGWRRARKRRSVGGRTPPPPLMPPVPSGGHSVRRRLQLTDGDNILSRTKPANLPPVGGCRAGG